MWVALTDDEKRVASRPVNWALLTPPELRLHQLCYEIYRNKVIHCDVLTISFSNDAVGFVDTV
jgi:hypothetical protein